jgi:hypothetical protein
MGQIGRPQLYGSRRSPSQANGIAHYLSITSSSILQRLLHLLRHLLRLHSKAEHRRFLSLEAQEGEEGLLDFDAEGG